jgi:hypothetical protein
MTIFTMFTCQHAVTDNSNDTASSSEVRQLPNDFPRYDVEAECNALRQQENHSSYPMYLCIQMEQQSYDWLKTMWFNISFRP